MMSDQGSDSSMEDDALGVPSSTPKSEDTKEEHDTTGSSQQASTSKGQPSTSKTSSSTKRFVCGSCINSKPFATKQSLQRHMRSIHEKKRSTGTAAFEPKNLFSGTESETDDTKPGDKRRHTNDDTNEDGEPASTSRKNPHMAVQKEPQSPPHSEDEDEVPLMDDTNEDGEPASTSRKNPHMAVQKEPQSPPHSEDEDEVPLMDEDPLEFPPNLDSPDTLDIIRENWAKIRTNRKDGRPAQDVYNFRLYKQPKWSEMQRNQLLAIFEKLDCRCKLNISFGLLLRHSETNELRYFHPSNNNARLFEMPFIITSRDDMMRFIHSVEEEEPLNFASHQRPSTKWSVHEITNMVVYVNKMPDLPIGCCSIDELPPFLKKNRGLHSLVKSRQTGKVFEDNLCFFRCLALHNGFSIKNCEKETTRLFGEYKKKQHISGDDFQGIFLEELPDLEKQFETNIMVYSIPAEGASDDGNESSRKEDDDDGEEEVEPLDTSGVDPNAEPGCSQHKLANPKAGPRRSTRNVAKPKEGRRRTKRKLANPKAELCRSLASSDTNPHSTRKSKKQKKEEVSNEEVGVSGDDDQGEKGDTEPEPRQSQRKTPGAQKQEQKKTFAKLVTRSRMTKKKTMYLNLFKRHFSYIKDFNLYSNTFCCTNTWCQRVFRRSNGLKIHMAKCSKNIKHRFPGSVYRPAPSIFDRLLDENISVPAEDRCFPHRATFRFEIFPDTSEKTEKTTKTRVEYKHIPLSVSVLSNVQGFEEPKCFISKGDPQQLVNEMIEYLYKISEASYKFLMEKFQLVFKELDKQLRNVRTQDNSDSKGNLKRHLTKLRKDFEDYLKELPVLGFESSKYGINLVKQYLYTSLKKSNPLQYVIKRNNTYLAIKTEFFKFLDISNYLVQGCTLADFLKSYEFEEAGGFFPFGWMDSLEKLNQETLPPKAEFESELIGTSSLSAEGYKTCTEVWDKKRMQTMSDYLEWYSVRNLAPFMKAVEKMSQFYKDKNIDMFKDGISAPGLSLRYLFQSMPGDDFFTLIEAKHKDFYHTLKDNIVGGPSIVFHRYHEKGETKIRGGKPCEKVIGYDANALYLSCLMQEMPVGPFIRRKDEDNFKPQVSHWYMTMAIEWLEWESLKVEGRKIQHKGNAREKRIGPTRIRVDGYCKETNTVYEFHGCYWHGHRCWKNKKMYNEKLKKPMKQLLEETEKRAELIRKMDYKLEEKWECEWEEEKADSKELMSFLESRRLPLQRKESMTTREIIKAIRSGNIFGFVECDINVPDSKKEKFSEMTPIFKNIDIACEKSVIGDDMYGFAKSNQLLTKPRRTLIGSMCGKKILLTTPLLKWYLQNGLEVTKIYQVFQYRPSSCFEMFGKEVSDARRDGDASGSTARADTMKLIGNSAYGKTVTNKENFKDVKICMTAKHASQFINDQRFRSATDIGEGVHEIELGKRSVKVDLPQQIGLFVYQYAKLKMLQFYYEFLDKYIDRSDFQLCQMDTDSAYIAIAGNNLESVIKPEMKEEYEREKDKWFPRRDTPENERYDKRTPGLFKVEFEGDGVVALCSKTYICFGGDKVKVSSKGLNKKQNDLRKKEFLDVLETKQTGFGRNIGYKREGKDMVTYSQLKGALSYLYIKRKVDDDRVTTTYLDI
ncbi:uncharacterized protein [Asterias amurensis]|uniref:uncharacterized protein n=1 Tax=Asterias amurensis TaxID=7602 RepID=UPI003AB4BC32